MDRNLSKVIKERIAREKKYICYICKKTSGILGYSIDHKNNWCKCFDNSPENLELICNFCHHLKNNDYEKYKISLEYYQDNILDIMENDDDNLFRKSSIIKWKISLTKNV